MDILRVDPEPEYVEYTIEEVYAALKQDGFEHLRGKWTS